MLFLEERRRGFCAGHSELKFGFPEDQEFYLLFALICTKQLRGNTVTLDISRIL